MTPRLLGYTRTYGVWIFDGEALGDGRGQEPNPIREFFITDETCSGGYMAEETWNQRWKKHEIHGRGDKGLEIWPQIEVVKRSCLSLQRFDGILLGPGRQSGKIFDDSSNWCKWLVGIIVLGMRQQQLLKLHQTLTTIPISVTHMNISLSTISILPSTVFLSTLILSTYTKYMDNKL